jgi:hypothetical protein|tara:strand:- start:7 stop:495 length:489 start_codon:yes stop_codon:yes gene_type:complete
MREKKMTQSKWNDLLIGAFKRPKKWRLEKPLTFQSSLTEQEIKHLDDCGVDIKITKSGKITVPLGYVTDLASVPRICWIAIAPFDVARPAVVHDILYEKVNAMRPHTSKKDFAECRRIADLVFLQGMEATDPLVSSWKKYSAYYAVRMFGRFAIKSSAKRTW